MPKGDGPNFSRKTVVKVTKGQISGGQKLKYLMMYCRAKFHALSSKTQLLHKSATLTCISKGKIAPYKHSFFCLHPLPSHQPTPPLLQITPFRQQLSICYVWHSGSYSRDAMRLGSTAIYYPFTKTIHPSTNPQFEAQQDNTSSQFQHLCCKAINK